MEQTTITARTARCDLVGLGLGFLVSLVVFSACSGDQTGPGRNSRPSAAVDNASKPSTPDAVPDNTFGNGDASTPIARPALPPNPVMDGTSCGINCQLVEVGAGSGMPFDLKGNPNEGVGLAPDGALIAEQDAPSDMASFIWIADSGATPPVVSKIDTRTFQEVARYEVAAVDPSRTSVSLTGDAYVSSRAGMAVTKISVLGANCPDTNGDGMVTTSTGPNDVLTYGQDDCVLWSQTFPMEIRGVAAQDILGETMVEPQLEGPPLVTSTPEQHFVWVGSASPGDSATARAYKLDGDTGEILIDTAMPRGSYGFALDGRGILWLTGGAYWDGNLAFIDTNKCVDTASCNVAPCTSTCSATVCPATCDDAVKGDITLDPTDTYGITVDCQQRVWLGGSGIKRYDPLAPADQRLVVGPSTDYVAGIAADSKGWVWGAGGNNNIVRLDAETLTQTASIPVSDYVHGVAVDVDGKIWGISMEDDAHVITPGPTVDDNPLQDRAVTGLILPYTYSDMTGVQLQLAAGRKPGLYNHVFEGCGKGMTTWNDFSWEAETPADTSIVFQARTADTINELENAEWSPLAGAPSSIAATSVSIKTEFGRKGVTPGKYVEVQVALNKAKGSASKCGDVVQAESPRVMALGVQYSCPVDDPE